MPAPSIPDLIAELALHFPRETLSPDRARAIFRELADLDPADVAVAVRELIRTSEFFPTVARIRAVATERSLALPHEDEALAQMERHVFGESARLVCPVCLGKAEVEFMCGECQDRGWVYGKRAPIHPLVKEALDLVGGVYGYKAAEEPSVIRGQFLRLYRGLRERTLQEARVGQVALEAGPKRRELSPPGEVTPA